MATPQNVLDLAASKIGISGTDNEFNLWYWGFHCYDPNTYPWCAAFASWVLCHAGVPCNASASASGLATQYPRVADEDVRPGDLVVFNWDGRQDIGWCDHVGIVEWSDINGSGYFGTIEGNTGYTAGGEVARVTRYNFTSYFTAFFRPSYDGSSGGGGGYEPTPEPAPGPSAEGTWWDALEGRYDTGGSGDDYAGVPGRPMLYLAIAGVGEYKASDIHNGWWPTVSGYDLNDEEYGVAGAGAPIDMVRIFDPSVKYQTHNLGGGWNDVMVGTYDTGGSGDDFAGQPGVQQDLIRIWRDDGDQPRYNVFS